MYDVQFTEPSDDPGATTLSSSTRARGQRRLQRDRGRQERRDEVFGGKEAQDFAQGEGRQRTAAGGLVRRAAAAPLRDRRSEDAVGVHRRERHGQAGGPHEMAGDGAWIDFAGPPGHIRDVLVLARRAPQLPARHVPRQVRGHRAVRAVAAGRHPTSWPADDDVGPGDPRQRDRHAACAASRCTTSRGLADLLIALGRAPAAAASRRPARRSWRSASGSGPRSLPTPCARSSHSGAG